MTQEEFVRDVLDEVNNLRRRQPDADGLLAATFTTVGETAEAVSTKSPNLVYVRCVQLAANAMRLALEGDPCYDIARANAGLPPFLGVGEGGEGADDEQG